MNTYRVYSKFICYLFWGIFCFLVSCPSIIAQCAMCRAVLDNPQQQGVAQGINDGIVYLMVLPYVFVAFVAFMCYRLYKKSYKQEIAVLEEQPEPHKEVLPSQQQE